MRAAFVVLILAAAAGCSPHPEPAPAPAFDFKTRVGVANLHADKTDGCLAMVNPSVAPGTKLTLVDYAADNALTMYPPGVGDATVVERLIADCDKGHLANYDVPSAEVRVSGPDYYRLQLGTPWNGSPYVLAIVNPASAVTLVDKRPRGDLDGDGKKESFRACASSEGIHYQVWSGEPFTGQPRWHWYVYAGYDLESTCTDKDYFGPK